MAAFRINLFARFFGLCEGITNYSVEELNKYIEVFDYVTNISQAGIPIQNPDGDLKYYIP